MGILRVLLAISVIAAHCGILWKFSLVDGAVAVEAFFIISGFYMSLILNEKYVKENSSYLLFITNRFLRLYPVYWGVLIATGLFSIIIYLASGKQSFPIVESYLSVQQSPASLVFLIGTNLLIFGQDIIMFLGINPSTGHLFFTDNFWNTSPPLYTFLFIQQAWSLGLELTFYLVAPFILRKSTIWIVALIFLSLVLRMCLYDLSGLRNDPWTYRFFPTEIGFFLIGGISYRIYVRIKDSKVPEIFYKAITVYIVLLTMLFGYIPTIKSATSPFSWNEILYFLSIVSAIPFLFNYFRNKKFDNWIGELSYPVYLSHLLIARIVYALPYDTLKQSWSIVTLSVLFSYCLNVVIAKPMERFRQGRLRRSHLPKPGF